MLRVSIIVPCFNVERFIDRCIQSVLNQTYSNIEIICIDDGSKDDTVKVIEKRQILHPGKIRLLKQLNKGACSARNSGIKIATGYYYQFLDADDELLPEKIESQITLSEKYNLPDLIIGSYIQLNEVGHIFKTRIYSNFELENQWEKLMKTDLGITSSNLFKSTIFKEISWNENLSSSQEYSLMFEILKRGKALKIDPEPLTKIHVRSTGSISSSVQYNVKLNYAKLRGEIISFLYQFDQSLLSESIVNSYISSIEMLYPFNPQESFRLISLLSNVHCENYIKHKRPLFYLLLNRFINAKKIINLQLKIKTYLSKFYAFVS